MVSNELTIDLNVFGLFLKKKKKHYGQSEQRS